MLEVPGEDIHEDISDGGHEEGMDYLFSVHVSLDKDSHDDSEEMTEGSSSHEGPHDPSQGQPRVEQDHQTNLV